MICSTCNAPNDDDNVFCVSCGNTVAAASSFASQKTAVIPFMQPQQTYPPRASTETPIAGYGHAAAQKRGGAAIWLGLVGVVLIAGVGAGAYFLVSRSANGETLPDHLGMFVQTDAKDRADEIRRQDFSSAVEAKNNLMKADLSSVTSQPNMILYADSKDIPLNDIRLVQLDTIKDDGTMKTLDFQAAPVDGKPEMKRLRVPQTLASGRYAFALFDGYFNDGKHKFWPFQVRDSIKTDNGDALKAVSISVKPSAPAHPRIAGPVAPPPSVGSVAYSRTGNLVLRTGPGQSYPKIRNLATGEQVYILGYSFNTEAFKGQVAPFAQVRTMNGQEGWAFSAYLR